jgi:transposase
MRLRPQRDECPYCPGNPTTTQQRSWYTPRRSFRRAYEEQLLFILVNRTIQDVCLKEDVGYEAIMGSIDRYMAREINGEDLTQGAVLGLDEISLQKGHRDFVALITGRLETEPGILGGVPDRTTATVKACLRGISQRLRQTMYAVCSDRDEGFVHAAKEVLGKRVQSVMDRFPVAQRYRSGLDKLRKQA